MKEIEGCFDSLVFTECVLGRARVHEQTVTIPIRGLFVSRAHPLAKQRPGPFEGELVFSGVVASRRRLTECAVGPRAADAARHDRFEIETFPGPDQKPERLHEFTVGGHHESPAGGIDDWLIRASAFKLCVR